MHYSTDRPVNVDQFRDLLLRSGLSERRPVEDLACLQGMLDHADITATCWIDGHLVGISRSITDFHYCCYLSDLAVDRDFQSQGIGAKLISLTQSLLQPRCKIILLAAPSAMDYYPHIGFDQHPSAWVLPRDRALKVPNP